MHRSGAPAALFSTTNNDGRLDLFVCNYLLWSKEIDLAQDFKLTGTDTRAYGKPQSFGRRFPYLYRNDGGGKFRDVSEEMGVRTVNSDQGVPLAKSLGVVAADFGPGWLDGPAGGQRHGRKPVVS